MVDIKLVTNKHCTRAYCVECNYNLGVIDG